MRRILVTGATGFLGGAVARDLAARGFEALATGRDPAAGQALLRAGIPFHPCDLATEVEELNRLAGPCDAIVHCAALSSPWGPARKFHSANVSATENVVNAGRAAGVKRLVHISSPSVSFAYQRQHLLKESAPWDSPSANHYIATKRMAESLVLGSGLDVIVLRPKALFGPGDQTTLPRLLRVAARGRFPRFGEDVLLDLTWIGDAASAVHLALTAGSEHRGKIYHVTSGDPQSRDTILETLLAACGLRVTFPRLPTAPLLALAGLLERISEIFTLSHWEPPLTRYSVGALAFGQTLDISAARRDLGYAPTTKVLEALQSTGERWRAGSTPNAEAQL